jgi:hypothetical protein
MAATVAIASCHVYSIDLLGTGTSTGIGGAATSSSIATGGGGASTVGASSSSSTSASSGASGAASSASSSASSAGASGSSASSGSSSSSAASTSSTSSSGGTNDVLWISQVKTRGLNGGSDEWVEIYNPASTPVTFDATWALKARNATLGLSGCATVAYGTRFNGGGQAIPGHGHILYANSAGFSESAATPADGTYPTNFGLPDAASIILVHGNAVVDALCFYYDATTQGTLACPGNPFTCAGTPGMNPHDNTTATDVNASLERKPGGTQGNTSNTQDNATDFAARTTADPHDLASAPVP